VDRFLASLASELSSRLIKESFVGSHMVLKVMRRAADAPLDPPKHLGHGKCDTFNKSVQLGVTTNDAEILGKETVVMMRSLRIPPAELRGIGLQMNKLEPVGLAKVETGQKTLDFRRDALPTPSAHRLASRVTPPQATQFIAPSQIDPEVLANLPEDIRNRIVSKRNTIASHDSTSHQADDGAFMVADERRVQMPPQQPRKKLTPKKKPSPRKIKQLSFGQSKITSSPDNLDASVLAELPSTIRQEVLSDARREKALARATQARHLAWAEEKARRDRKVTRTFTISDPPAKPTFQRLSDLSDLRDLISQWFDELGGEGPAH